MKNYVFKTAASAAFVVALVSATITHAQTAPDDTARNRREKVTADNQKDTKSDRLLTAKVRRAVVADKDLSMYAHNVKIITVNGAITLKGPVKSEEEKQKVAAIAVAASSADAVTNLITVK